ncbi:DUF2017 family protein [Egicoccus halophilus]|uniref:DUF2017 domain-containing protein n=1 Tax=Egicoccus halophilus TaxID=1670830 RepID=A0A8J3A8U2_9ACTN|nr:DUF2017 family protein [Egicoccus halophilus]GGI04741.1 hypothetical protein GCM10011354_10610 [Egicoccus halophilus]
MSRAFRRQGDAIRMDLEPVEVDLLHSLRDGLREALVGHDVDDPIVRRLFPTAVSGDGEADRELRRLLHDELLTGRLRGLEELTALLEGGVQQRGRLRVRLTFEDATLVLGVLNDLRLAIGARVGIEDLARDGLDPDDPVVHRLAVMDHLAWLQEQLLAILDPASVSHDDDAPE